MASAIGMPSNPRGYQLMAQLLLAHHVMTDDEAYEWYLKLVQAEQNGEIGGGTSQDSEDDDNDDDGGLGFDPPAATPAATLDAMWTRINATLKPFLELEIVTVIVNGQRQHAMVNAKHDEVVRMKETFVTRYNAHERAFTRLLLQRLVEEGDDTQDNDEENEDNDINTNKAFALKRSDCINLRSELPNNYKLTLEQAGYCIQVLLDDRYLQIAADNDDDATAHSQSQGGGHRRRRESVQNKLELAPRAYLELSHVLTEDCGMPAERMPQFLYHRP